MNDGHSTDGRGREEERGGGGNEKSKVDGCIKILAGVEQDRWMSVHFPFTICCVLEEGNIRARLFFACFGCGLCVLFSTISHLYVT